MNIIPAAKTSAWIVLVLTTGTAAYWLGTYSREQLRTTAAATLPKPGSYLTLMPQDCQNTDTADATQCIADYATSTAAEADTLAQRLVLEAPERLRQLPSTPGSPPSFVYGGSDFLKDLPVGVTLAQKTRVNYIDTLCRLDSMNLYGGTGQSMEYWACMYYNDRQYLEILKSLEEGVTATSTR